MSTPIQNSAIKVVGQENEGIPFKSVAATAKAGIKYLIASFLNEKTGGKFSFLRNWEDNSANHLLEQVNQHFSGMLAEKIKQCANNAQSWADTSKAINCMKCCNTTKAFVDLGEKSLQYLSDLLTGSEKNQNPQTVNRLLTITGTLYQENQVLRAAMDHIKDEVLKLAFSEKNIENLFNNLNLKIFSKPAQKLIVLLGVKDKIDAFLTKKILDNKEFNLNKKDLVKTEEKLLYKTLSFFSNYNGEKWSDDDIKSLFEKTDDPWLKGLLQNYQAIENLYQDSRLMNLISKGGANFCTDKILINIFDAIALGKSIDKSIFLDLGHKIKQIGSEKISDTIEKVEENIENIKEKVKEVAVNVKEKVEENIENVTGVIQSVAKDVKEGIKMFPEMENIFSETPSGKELQDVLDEANAEPVKTNAEPKANEGLGKLINEGEIAIIKDIKKEGDKIQSQKKENQSTLTLSDLQKDFSPKDAESLRDVLNDKVKGLTSSWYSIEDAGNFWTATYILTEKFSRMLTSSDLTIEVDDKPLEYDEDATERDKEKVLALNKALVDNPTWTDGTSIVNTLSVLADEETLLGFIPGNIKGKITASRLKFVTVDAASSSGAPNPHINLKIKKDNPITAEIDISWNISTQHNSSQEKHTLGLKFTSELNLNEEKVRLGWLNGTKIGTEISSIKNIEYVFDGKPLESNKIDDADLAS